MTTNPEHIEITTQSMVMDDLLRTAGRAASIVDLFGKKFAITNVESEHVGHAYFSNAKLTEVFFVDCPWTGEGLPPTGTVCEACWTSPDEYYHIKVLAHDDGKAVYRWLTGPGAGELSENEDDILCAAAMPHPRFRPLRTPEQIAAEERERAIDDLCASIVSHYEAPKMSEHYLGLARALHDAGYRKQA